MGLFDFLKKKDNANEPTQQQNPQNEKYFGDLNKTGEIVNLVKIPHKDRDQNWTHKFLSNLAEASFRCGDPQVVTGPDGLPYFQLFLPEPHRAFQCFVIDRMKDDFLLEEGFGIVINPTEQQPDWVLSYGDILNLHLNKTFYTSDEHSFSKATEEETIEENEEVIIGQPSETLLPQVTRKLLSAFLKMNGIESPKVLLMMRKMANGQGVLQDLVFNVTPYNFKNEEAYRTVMQTLSWYLPRHYSFMGMDEKTMENGFMPL